MYPRWRTIRGCSSISEASSIILDVTAPRRVRAIRRKRWTRGSCSTHLPSTRRSSGSRSDRNSRQSGRRWGGRRRGRSPSSSAADTDRTASPEWSARSSPFQPPRIALPCVSDPALGPCSLPPSHLERAVPLAAPRKRPSILVLRLARSSVRKRQDRLGGCLVHGIKLATHGRRQFLGWRKDTTVRHPPALAGGAEHDATDPPGADHLSYQGRFLAGTHIPHRHVCTAITDEDQDGDEVTLSSKLLLDQLVGGQQPLR